ncbi:hypothetical protein Q4610_10850 [Sphingobium sp. HBC34]|uniref:OmpR/PhoB-type domain-containing protein n=1 Tax=Sphingobium cyanobacteriorum TaxID=3063954 RepID=A0ABT8ZP60_9SPHN|nr:hypothetical protein [Sphingobium sp. HBC34]MDO7835540.1 hypothetical protein [Sphingobium sp. HBC34]
MDATHAADPSDPASAFAQEAANFRELLSAGRSPVFLQLFDFLLSRSQDERAPKEVEIALAVFGKDGAEGAVGDSAVRVYVHRLRKRLDDHYAGRAGHRLHIPKGEYRILLSAQTAAAMPDTTVRWPGLPRWRVSTYIGVIALLLAANIAIWWLVAPARPPGDPALQLRSTSFWHPLALDKPSLVVTGDAFLLAEAEQQKDIKRLILDPAIRSRSDFGSYLTNHPDAFYSLYDLDLHYTPVGTAVATWSILPVVHALHSARGSEPLLVPSSRLRPAALESNDIVYVGRLSSLGLVAPPLFQASGFTWDQADGILKDRRSGKAYSDVPPSGQESQLRRDYGYIASFSVPSGRHILVIAGLGDRGVESMAQLVTNPVEIGQLAGQRAATRSFEALYEVKSMDNVALDRTLLLVRPLRSAAPMPARPRSGR